MEALQFSIDPDKKWRVVNKRFYKGKIYHFIGAIVLVYILSLLQFGEMADSLFLWMSGFILLVAGTTYLFIGTKVTILLTEDFIRYKSLLTSEDIAWEDLSVTILKNGDLLLGPPKGISFYNRQEQLIVYQEFQSFKTLSYILLEGKPAVQRELARG
ncbi:hypothetical protein AB9P05_12965 [Roseivirga sp. BDSF3-8]|uniref:hypothetical protein n=1 Tax=Roseivirga sp. BDSF3-8 TaxID=3241598 RepID=UPI003531B9CD